MFPDVTTAVAADVRHDRIDRAGYDHRARLAHAARPAGPCSTLSSSRGPGLPRLGCRFRHWLAAGYL